MLLDEDLLAHSHAYSFDFISLTVLFCHLRITIKHPLISILVRFLLNLDSVVLRNRIEFLVLER
jgi:hypothetical protein